MNASIADFDRPVVRLDLVGVGPAQDLVRFANDSPLNARLGGITTSVQATGETRFNMRLALPLDHLDQTTVDGGILFSGNTVGFEAAIPALSQVQGRLDFSDRGFALRDLRGVFLGGPIALEANTQTPGPVKPTRAVIGPKPSANSTPASAATPPIEVRAAGTVSAVGLRQLADNDILRRFSGNTRYEAQLTIQGSGTRLRLTSDLMGLGSVLPAPFAKSAETAMPLAL